LVYPERHDDVAQVLCLNRLQSIDARGADARRNAGLLLRIVPYRTLDDRIEGVRD
jgi:hypothetical protein